MDRETRRIQNTKQSSLEFVGKPSLHNMLEGQFAVEKQSNSQLGIYRKKFGQIWKSLMSNNGDQVVERHLNVSGITKSKVTAKNLIFEKGSTLEIASGEITITHSLHEVEVQGASGNDNLDTINGGVDGQILILRAFNGARTVTLRNDEGNIYLLSGSDFALDTAEDVAVLLKKGADWYVIVTASI